MARAVLLNLGYLETDLVRSDSGNQGSFELFDEKPVKFKRVQKLFRTLRLKGVKVQYRRLKPADWVTRWKDQWKPAALTKTLDVVPVWCKSKYKLRRGRDFILMDTLLSFGTGLHETTQIMAQFIEDNRGIFKTFLDIGTGTGILGFVALKNEAAKVIGIDIGQLSVQAARDNMKANDLYFNVKKADIKTFKSSLSFDFVAANLITDDLITHARKILSLVKNNGLLAVSGISLTNLAKIRKAYGLLPLKCIRISKGKQWSGLLYQKMMS